MIENFDPAVRKAARRIAESRREEQLVAERIFAFRKGFECGTRLAVISAESADEADHVGQALQVLRRHGASCVLKLVRQRVRLLSRLLGGARDQLFGGCDVRLQEQVESVETVGKRSDHSNAPSGGYADAEHVIAARIFAHRLSETFK